MVATCVTAADVLSVSWLMDLGRNCHKQSLRTWCSDPTSESRAQPLPPSQSLLSRLLDHPVPFRSPCHTLGSGHTESSSPGMSTPAGSLLSSTHLYVILDSVPRTLPSVPNILGCGWCSPTRVLHLLKCLRGECGTWDSSRSHAGRGRLSQPQPRVLLCLGTSPLPFKFQRK